MYVDLYFSSRLYAYNKIYIEHHNDRIDIYCFHFIGKYRSFCSLPFHEADDDDEEEKTKEFCHKL